MADSRQKNPRRYQEVGQDVLACLLLAVATVCIFHSWLFEGRALYWGDIGLYFLPMVSFARQELLHGTIPLWNPHILCGAPYIGNPQVWPLYPTSFLAVHLASPIYLTLFCVLHIYLAGVFFTLFLRRSSLGLGLWASLLGASCYMFGGYVAAKAQFPNMLQALTYVPLVLLLVDRLVLQPSLSRALALGAAVGLQLLAAHAQVSLMTFYLAIAYALWLWRAAGAERAPFLRLAGWFCVAGGAGLGLSAGQWLPVAQLVRYARYTLSLGEANRFYLPLGGYTNFIWPFRFGSPMQGDWHAHGNIWEVACFVGIVPFLLALFAIAFAMAKEKENLVGARRFWLGVFLVSIWLAFGRQAGLYIVAFYALPGMSAFHDPARMLLGAAMALSVLAAIGLQDIFRKLGEGRYRIGLGIAAFVLTVIVLGWYDGNLYPLKPSGEIEAMSGASIPTMLRSDQVIASGQGRAFMADPYKPWIFFTSYKRYGQADPDFLSHWADTLTPNFGMLFGIDAAGGYEPDGLRASKFVASQAESWARPNSRQGSNGELAGMLGEMSVRDVVVYRNRALISPGLTEIAESDWLQDENKVWVYRNDRFLSRARAFAKWSMSRDTTLPSGMETPLLVTDHGPDETQILVPATVPPCIVELADTEYPGWYATVDGKLAPIVSVDQAFRGVILREPGGAARTECIVFRYKPEVFVVGLYLTLLTCCVFAGAIAASLVRSVWQTQEK